MCAVQSRGRGNTNNTVIIIIIIGLHAPSPGLMTVGGMRSNPKRLDDDDDEYYY